MVDVAKVKNDVATELIELERTEPENQGLVPMTIRLDSETNQAITKLAKEHKLSKADVVRMAIDGGLSRYLNSIRYIEPEQGKQIQKAVTLASNEITEIGKQLKRIGINYNQEVRLKNLETKKQAIMEQQQQAVSGKHIDTNLFIKCDKDIRKLEEQEKKIKESETVLSKTELENLMAWYEEITDRLGEMLWGTPK